MKLRFQVVCGFAFALMLVVEAAATATAATKPKLYASYPASIAPGSALLIEGRMAGRAPGARVAVQQRRGSRWVTRAIAPLRGSRYRVQWRRPPSRGTLTVRAALMRGRRVLAISASASVRVAKPVRTSAPVRTPDPREVRAVPSPGRSGTVVLAGGFEARKGDFLAFDAGPRSPDGFLGRITAVRFRGNSTAVSTVPATLREVLPVGAFSQRVSKATLRAAGVRLHQEVSKSISCEGDRNLSIGGGVTLDSDLEVEADWGVLSLNSASAIARVTAGASLTATATAAASCTVAPVELARFNLPKIRFAVGPVPVVITPRIVVLLSGEGHISAALASDLGGSISAEAGLRYTKDDGFTPVGSFDQQFTNGVPRLDGEGRLTATLTPSADLLVYGVAGPQMTFATGLELTAALQPNPAWALHAPVSLTASLAIPALDLESPTLPDYANSFLLASGGVEEPDPDPRGTWNGRVTFRFTTAGGNMQNPSESAFSGDMHGTIEQARTGPPVVSVSWRQDSRIVDTENGCSITSTTTGSAAPGAAVERFYVLAFDGGYRLLGGNLKPGVNEAYFKVPMAVRYVQQSTCPNEPSYEESLVSDVLFSIPTQPGPLPAVVAGSTTEPADVDVNSDAVFVTWEVRP